jgi:hypothetical protein
VDRRDRKTLGDFYFYRIRHMTAYRRAPDIGMTAHPLLHLIQINRQKIISHLQPAQNHDLPGGHKLSIGNHDPSQFKTGKMNAVPGNDHYKQYGQDDRNEDQ